MFIKIMITIIINQLFLAVAVYRLVIIMTQRQFQRKYEMVNINKYIFCLKPTNSYAESQTCLTEVIS